MEEINPIEQRLAMKDRLDTALELGELTLATLRSVPPTATSIEHHTTLMKVLKAREKLSTTATKDTIEMPLQ